MKKLQILGVQASSVSTIKKEIHKLSFLKKNIKHKKRKRERKKDVLTSNASSVFISDIETTDLVDIIFQSHDPAV